MNSRTNSRYGQKRFIRPVDEDNYVIYGESKFYRVGEDYFDFQGGPFIFVGMPAKELGIADDRNVVSVKPLDCKDEGWAECMVGIG